MAETILKMEMALQDGVTAEITDDGRVILTIRTDLTKRDLWLNQTEIWLSEENGVGNLSSGYLRVTKKNKLEFKARKA